MSPLKVVIIPFKAFVLSKYFFCFVFDNFDVFPKKVILFLIICREMLKVSRFFESRSFLLLVVFVM